MSAVGSTETHRALVNGSPDAIGFAAFDAGLVDIDPRSSHDEPVFVERTGSEAGASLAIAEIERRFGARLREEMGIRPVGANRRPAHVSSDLAASLPHRLEEEGRLRALAGVTQQQVRQSSLREMFSLFDDDPRLGPSIQTQLFVYAGLGALASLPVPLSELVVRPRDFRIAAATAFHGLETAQTWQQGMQPHSSATVTDKFANRLAATLASHGPALLNSMLAPSYNLSRVMRDPSLLAGLAIEGQALRRVPQAPLTSMGACASSTIALSEIAPQMFLRYPGHHRPALVLWTAADAVLAPDYTVLEAFGIGAMMSRGKLEELNAGRAEGERRGVADCLAPFDIDARGTVVGNAGSGLLVTTLEFAIRHHLDVTSLVVGWGQSGETGGKAHFAGVGFGGENALIAAFEMAREGHGYGVADFSHFVAHGTGTRTNSRTELQAVDAGRRAAALAEGFTRAIPSVTVGAPKAIGDGHSMGETGLKAFGEALRYVNGERTVGVSTLRRLDPDLGPPADLFRLSARPVDGQMDGGALTVTQGFGGYDGALLARGAHPDSLRRYLFDDDKMLGAYLERWPETRRLRLQNEARWRRRREAARLLAETHRWPGL
jgi:3-oxoacyl-[acyl-carrier-protein] synthase II